MLRSWAQLLQHEGKAWSVNVEKWMECMRNVHGKGENKENHNTTPFLDFKDPRLECGLLR